MVRAARYLKVAPWELAERPVAWRDWALAAEEAEIYARNQAAKKANRGARR